MLAQLLAWCNGLTDGLWGSSILFAVGALLLIKGGDWFVDSAVGIAKKFRVPEIIIGATVVSIGTTLPEVMLSVTAAVSISPFAVPEGSKLFGYNTSQLIEIPIMVAVMALMTLPALAKGKLHCWQGISLLGIYVAFVALQVLIALHVI